MAIEANTFISDVVLFIRNLLRDNLSDPLGRDNGIGFVMTAFPKRNTQYPIVTIRQVNISTAKLGMQSEVHSASLDLEIQIFSRNSKECDELTQEVIDILRLNHYGDNSTDVEEIHGFDITSIVPVVDTEGENTIHRKIIGVNYLVILCD